MNWKDVQTAINNAGFNPGPIDGIPGRLTINALKRFQTSRRLKPDGIPGPLTWGELRKVAPTFPSGVSDTIPPWMAILEHKMGLNETKDNKELREFLKSDGATLGDPSKWPWCGDLIETIIALTLTDERLPTNPYLARNWQTFGVASPNQDRPGFGAIGAFWRTDKVTSTNGHVATIIGINKAQNKFRIRGGNQSNSISDVWIAKDRLLSARVPSTWTIPLPLLPIMDDAGQPLSTNEA